MTQNYLTQFPHSHNREHTRRAFKNVYDRDPTDAELEAFTEYLKLIHKEVG